MEETCDVDLARPAPPPQGRRAADSKRCAHSAGPGVKATVISTGQAVRKLMFHVLIWLKANKQSSLLSCARKQQTTNNQRTKNTKRQTTNNKQQSIKNKHHQTNKQTNNKQRISINKQQTTNNKHRTNNKQPTTNHKQQTTGNKQQTTNS